MKGKTLFIVLIGMLFFGMSIFAAQAASTPSYLGQTSWTMNFTINTIDTGMVGKSVTLTGGLTKIGDNYYSFQGFITNYGTNPMVLSGGGAIINGKLILTLSDSWLVSSPNGDRDTGVMNVSLDTASNNYLNGSFSEIHFVIMDNTMFENGVFAGTMTRTGNQIPLAPSYNAPLTLLLD